MAFIPGPALPLARQAAPRARYTCNASASNPSRRQLLTGGAAALLAASLAPFPAVAGGGTGLERAFSKVLFPKEGFNAPDNLTPSPSIVNKDILASKDAQAALSTIRSYDQGLADLFSKFKADPQVELYNPVRKLVSISALRNALNVVNEAIDESSQIETDKVVRGIIQDIGELQNSVAMKAGTPRTEKRIERTNDWFVKLTSDFTRLLSFYS